VPASAPRRSRRDQVTTVPMIAACRRLSRSSRSGRPSAPPGRAAIRPKPLDCRIHRPIRRPVPSRRLPVDAAPLRPDSDVEGLLRTWESERMNPFDGAGGASCMQRKPHPGLDRGRWRGDQPELGSRVQSCKGKDAEGEAKSHRGRLVAGDGSIERAHVVFRAPPCKPGMCGAKH
jgi:hypothetical protein